MSDFRLAQARKLAQAAYLRGEDVTYTGFQLHGLPLMAYLDLTTAQLEAL